MNTVQENSYNENLLNGITYNVEQINSLKIGTYNVLYEAQFPGIQRLQQSKKRFQFQIDEIFKPENFDILCLNEVTRNYYFDYLNKSQYITENYNICFNDKQIGQLRGLFNLILVKKHIQFNTILQKSRQVYAFVKFQNKAFILGSLHLCARELNYEYREKQIKKIPEQIKDFQVKIHNQLEKQDQILLSQAIQKNNIFLLGDFNLHLKSETYTLYKHNYLDLWVEQQHKLQDFSNPGYTWDAQKNSFQKMLLPLDNRRMRLDRMVIHKGSQNLNFSNMEIFGTQKIPGSCYLTPSDHYGLKINLEFQDENQSNNTNNNININNPLQFTTDQDIQNLKQQPKLTGFRSQKRIVFLRYACLSAAGLFLIGIITSCIFLI